MKCSPVKIVSWESLTSECEYASVEAINVRRHVKKIIHESSLQNN